MKDDLDALGPLSAAELWILADKAHRGVVHVMRCEHVDEEPHKLYGLPLRHPDGELLELYLCCRTCCAEALARLGTTN